MKCPIKEDTKNDDDEDEKCFQVAATHTDAYTAAVVPGVMT